MRSRSAPGSSTPTSRRTRAFLPLLVLTSVPLAGAYVLFAFLAPDPLLRIVMRCLPVLPVAIWTIWFERSRPLQQQSPLIRQGGRVLLFLAVMTFAVLLLGLALNWLYDPSRVA